MTPEQLDLAVWPQFVAMTLRGLVVSTDRLLSLRRDVLAELEVQEALVGAFAGEPLNHRSAVEVGNWLKDRGLARKRTRSGKVKTGKRELSLLTETHPLPAAILECRGLSKLVNTFIDPVLRKCGVHLVEGEPPAGYPRFGVVHPRWRLAGPAKDDDTGADNGGGTHSGRPSCTDPNLLAFPAHDSKLPGQTYKRFSKRVRDAFVPRDGFTFISVDFSQIEPRRAAALSQDPGLLDVYTTGKDVYADMARRIFRLPDLPDKAFKTDPDLYIKRQAGKAVLLGCVLYGKQATSLFEDFIKDGVGTPSKPNYSLAECEDFVRRRFEPYPGVAALVAQTVRAAFDAAGWASTSGGRRRLLPALLLQGHTWPESSLRAEAERQAFNHLIQGDAQEIMKEAMLRVEQAKLPETFPLLQIYDELVFESASSRAEETAAVLTKLMSTVCGTPVQVPIVAEASIADSWGAL